jgi:TctA family transporter
MYGGSTTSILVNTPGETASVVTAVEGYAMALALLAPTCRRLKLPGRSATMRVAHGGRLPVRGQD